MRNHFSKFRNDDAGAVSVDWVVLTAAVVLLAFSVYNAVGTGLSGLAVDIKKDLVAVPRYEFP